MSASNIPDVNDALNEFYKLKSTYETAYYTKYVKPIILSKDKSKREKRIDYSKLPKAECINCKRNVGTIFSIKNDIEEYVRIFTAKCGDSDDPCPLDINIEYAGRYTYDSQIANNDEDLTEIKTKIIKDKNDMMFGYISQPDAIQKFNDKTTELKDITEIAGFVINTNIVINENPEKKVLLKNLEDDFGINYLMPFKNMTKEYDDSNGTDQKKMHEAVKFYVNEMIPKIREIQDLKYETEFVDCEQSDNDDKYFLFQRKNSLTKLEFNFFSKDSVKSFVKGVLQPSANASSKTKTRKIRRKIEFELTPAATAAAAEPTSEPGVTVEPGLTAAETTVEPAVTTVEPGVDVEPAVTTVEPGVTVEQGLAAVEPTVESTKKV